MDEEREIDWSLDSSWIWIFLLLLFAFGGQDWLPDGDEFDQ